MKTSGYIPAWGPITGKPAGIYLQALEERQAPLLAERLAARSAVLFVILVHHVHLGGDQNGDGHQRDDGHVRVQLVTQRRGEGAGERLR
eukprot:4086045-Pyramimonas_sp.AAC.1